MKKLNKKGVSLAELLAVVVIMGIIAAIAIPLVGNVIETSKKKAFLGDLVTLTEAARTYCLVEGKDTNEASICYKYTPTTDVTVTDKGVVTVSHQKSLAGVLKDTDLTKITNYISKDLDQIGASGNIKIFTDGSKYYVQIVKEGTQKYKTSGIIDPTNENAIDLIPDKE